MRGSRTARRPFGRPRWWRGRRSFERLSAGFAGVSRSSVRPPAGGKTVLVRAWAEAAGLEEDRIAWVSVERDEHDAQRFWLSVVTALAAPAVVKDQRGSGANARIRGAAVVERLAYGARSLDEPVTLVIDDLHERSSPGAPSSRVCSRAGRPSSACPVDAGRSVPGLHRLRLAGELTEVRATELRIRARRDAPTARRRRRSLSPTTRSPAPRPHGGLGGRASARGALARGPPRPRALRRGVLRKRADRRGLPLRRGPPAPARACAPALASNLDRRARQRIARRPALGTTGSERILLELEDASAFVVSIDRRGPGSATTTCSRISFAWSCGERIPVPFLRCTTSQPSGTRSTGSRSTPSVTRRPRTTGSSRAIYRPIRLQHRAGRQLRHDDAALLEAFSTGRLRQSGAGRLPCVRRGPPPLARDCRRVHRRCGAPCGGGARRAPTHLRRDARDRAVDPRPLARRLQHDRGRSGAAARARRGSADGQPDRGRERRTSRCPPKSRRRGALGRSRRRCRAPPHGRPGALPTYRAAVRGAGLPRPPRPCGRPGVRSPQGVSLPCRPSTSSEKSGWLSEPVVPPWCSRPLARFDVLPRAGPTRRNHGWMARNGPSTRTRSPPRCCWSDTPGGSSVSARDGSPRRPRCFCRHAAASIAPWLTPDPLAISARGLLVQTLVRLG